jgi:hypothetical protein
MHARRCAYTQTHEENFYERKPLCRMFSVFLRATQLKADELRTSVTSRQLWKWHSAEWLVYHSSLALGPLPFFSFSCVLRLAVGFGQCETRIQQEMRRKQREGCVIYFFPEEHHRGLLSLYVDNSVLSSSVSTQHSWGLGLALCLPL